VIRVATSPCELYLHDFDGCGIAHDEERTALRQPGTTRARPGAGCEAIVSGCRCSPPRPSCRDPSSPGARQCAWTPRPSVRLPHFTLTRYGQIEWFKRPADLDDMLEGFRKAGLPE
jgi:hypothetical protein